MDSLPEDTLVLVTRFALPSALPSGRPPSLAHETRSLLRQVAELRRVNRRWRSALDDGDADSASSLWFHAARAVGLSPPPQLFARGTYRGVCERLIAVEDEKERLQREAASQPFVHAACGMMFPPEPHPDHPAPDRPPVTLPTSLKKRVADNAVALEGFLSSINFRMLGDAAAGGGSSSGSGRWHESALLRYRMFLHLKRTHPKIWLVPTADIEFCWLAHIFRTETYWKDVTALGIDPQHSLCLHDGEVATFTQAVEGTASLWNAMYGEEYPYLPEDADTSWQLYKIVRNMNAKPKVKRSDPRRFFPRMGPEVFTPPSGVQLPAVRLSAEEIQADLEWFPQLDDALWMLHENSYNVMRRSCDLNVLLLEQVLPSYERFLNLCNREAFKDDEAGPPFVLDLVWHAHQMEPVKYREDCKSLFGREFWHHPWPNRLGVPSQVTKEFECAWKTTYGTSIEDDWKFHCGQQQQ